MPRLYLILFFVSFSASVVFGQVNEIKAAASSATREVSRSASSSSDGLIFDLVFNLMIGNVVGWQQEVLARRPEQRSLISLDAWVQAGGQPSSYYLIQPRVRANWGLFSTDFRMSYVIEEGFEGPRHIRTTDWQVLQLNMVTTKGVTFRTGGGIIQESYANRNTHLEWTTALAIHPLEKKLSGMAEFRSAEIRTEVNGHLRYALRIKSHLHPYLLIGAAYQRYYQEVDVWGIQGGVGFSLY